MGNLKKGWPKGSIMILLATGFFFTGVLMHYYFQANAAHKPSNQPKNQTINKAMAKGPALDRGTIDISTDDLKKEQILRAKEQAIARRNQQEREKSNVKKPPTTVTDAAKPATNTVASTQPQALETKPAQSEAPKTPPASPSSQKTIYLTFDDGPSVYSGQIISLLEKYHYKATFFMVDGNIRRYQNAVKLMVQTGETVGLHSVSHNTKTFYASAASILAELAQNRNTLKEISGVDSVIMRTPYGSVPYMTAEYREAVHDHGYLMWDWNIDSRDWDYKDARYVNSVITQLNQLANHQGPIVILLHERKETLAYLPKLLEFLAGQGWIGKAIDKSMVPVQFKS
ncbi:polysaccharide deacetylase family protein [Bacillus sp. USDA818B3_A]|uniref:polysaccharide deacetylase family protein n=1 Tax=Bacillus sp. USDA818B3_A TaxID=2698834 RepID=UPI0013696CB4|nr:polysaccharide deacetylase family protein [Bacillus sp. USDA818B3_A]